MLVDTSNDTLTSTDEDSLQEIKAKMVQIDKDISEFKVMLVSYQSKVRRILFDSLKENDT
ncbi:protein of unknown function [Nitrosotalea devaniterrae]|uniref:Uncharacterized protein n=1 Tax=Nitrosotalea devaniterrae TaxID=1078905 RepID=A0A128A5K7_9ARCH|nr:protein of unknown function [Candidatus Nitrosotalea devanaterra]